MSEENLALARLYFEALNEHGLYLEGTRHFRHPEMELLDPPEFPDTGRHVGEAAIQERVQSFIDVGWDGQYRVEEYLDAGDEVIVVWHALGETAHGGGVPLDLTVAHVCLFEDGKVRRVRQFLSRADALEAVGLSEQGV
jgi:ketosteroid isomerase-like protein